MGGRMVVCLRMVEEGEAVEERVAICDRVVRRHWVVVVYHVVVFVLSRRCPWMVIIEVVRLFRLFVWAVRRDHVILGEVIFHHDEGPTFVRSMRDWMPLFPLWIIPSYRTMKYLLTGCCRL